VAGISSIMYRIVTESVASVNARIGSPKMLPT
jgi:hypothetical protein